MSSSTFGDGAAAGMRESAEYRAGYAMGLRHSRTGDPLDLSGERCEPLERERDEAARALPHTGPFGNGAFHVGYDEGYDAGYVERVSPSLPDMPQIRYRVFFSEPDVSSVLIRGVAAWVAAADAKELTGHTPERVELAGEPGEVVWQRPAETLIADPVVSQDESGAWEIRTAYFGSLLARFAEGREHEARFYAGLYTVCRPSVPARASRKYHAVDVEADVEGLAADTDCVRNAISELQSSELCRRTTEAGEAVEAAIAYLQSAADTLSKCRLALGGEPRYGEAPETEDNDEEVQAAIAAEEVRIANDPDIWP